MSTWYDVTWSHSSVQKKQTSPPWEQILSQIPVGDEGNRDQMPHICPGSPPSGLTLIDALRVYVLLALLPCKNLVTDVIGCLMVRVIGLELGLVIWCILALICMLYKQTCQVSRIWHEVQAFLAHSHIHATFLKIVDFHTFSGFSFCIHPKFCTVSSIPDFLICIFLPSNVLQH